MKRFLRKHKWITIVAVILVTALVVGIVAASTNAIGKISNSNLLGTRDRNPDNLFDPAWYEDLDGTRHDGIKIEVDEDGVITLNGTALYAGYITLCNEQVIEHEDYLVIGGCLDGSFDTYYLRANIFGSGNWAQSYNGNTNLILDPYDNTSAIKIELAYVQGMEFNNVKIYPTIGADEIISFYE